MCKRILALLLALTLCASLSACGGKQEEEAQPGGHELDEYFGWWQYDDYTSVIAFADGNAWSIYAGDGSLSYTGLFEFDGSGIRALDEQGETAHYFLLDETGTLLTDDEGDTLPLGSLTISVLYTPGHTAGSVTLKVGDALFVGDTLFAGSCGRTDLPGGDPMEMLASLRRLGRLEGDYTVYPGHMNTTTLAREKAMNPYLRQALR